MDHQQPRYWCHICQAQVDANLHGLTPNCLLCNSEFIEEVFDGHNCPLAFSTHTSQVFSSNIYQQRGPSWRSSSAEGTTRDPYTAAEGTPQSHTINQEGTHTFSFEYSHPADPNLGSAGHAGSETQTQPDQNHSNFPSEANHNLSEEGLSLEEQMLRRMFRRFSGNMNPNTTSSQDSRLATIAPILIQLLGIRGSLGDYVADGDSFEDIITRLFEQHTQLSYFLAVLFDHVFLLLVKTLTIVGVDIRGSDTQAAPSNIIASLPKEKFSKGTSCETLLLS
ncbi:hypothetical protein BSLG_001132 [Batrachochytrium salamandrivorans]|nr:hypothetical protein BSLG_001132 [Batrachochytrium salamandrivorans]